MDKPDADEMSSSFYYHLGFNKAESESNRIVIEDQGSKKDPKIIPYVLSKITYTFPVLVSSDI